MIISGNGNRYVRSLGAEGSWWDDEDASWWLTAARVVGGDTLVKTLSDAYSSTAAAAKTAIEQLKQTIAADLEKRAMAAGTAEAKKLAEQAEARIRKAAEQRAYAGGFHGMLLVGGAALLIWLFTSRR